MIAQRSFLLLLNSQIQFFVLKVFFVLMQFESRILFDYLWQLPIQLSNLVLHEGQAFLKSCLLVFHHVLQVVVLMHHVLQHFPVDRVVHSLFIKQLLSHILDLLNAQKRFHFLALCLKSFVLNIPHLLYGIAY